MYLQKALRGVSIVFILSLVSAGLAYAFRLLMAYKLTVDQYGLFYGVFAFFSLFLIIVDMGFTQAVSKFVISLKLKKKFTLINQLISNTYALQTVISLAIFALVLIFSSVLSKYYFKTNTSLLLLIMGIWFITAPIPGVFSIIFSSYQNFKVIGIMDTFKSLIVFLLTVIFFYFNFEIYAPFIAYASLHILAFIFFYPIAKRTFVQFNFNPFTKFFTKKVKEIFVYGLFITISNLLWYVMTTTDTIMLTGLRSLEEVGYYQVAIPLAFILFYIINAVNTVVYPMSSELYEQKKIKMLSEGIGLIYKYFMVLILPLAIVMLFYPDLVIRLTFSAKYVAAAGALRILSISAIFSSLTLVNNTILTATGFPKKVSKVMIITAIVNIILNAILIYYFGIVGAAIATMISFIIALVLSLIILKQTIPVKIPIYSWIKSVGCAAIFFLSVWFLKNTLDMNIWVETIITIFISMLLYIMFIFIFRVLKISEILDFVNVYLKK